MYSLTMRRIAPRGAGLAQLLALLGAARGYVDYTLTRQAGDSFNVPRVTVPQPEVSDVPFAGTHSEVYFTREKDRWDTETLGVLQPNNGLQDLATRLGYQGGYVKGTMEALGLARNEQRLVANATADVRAPAPRPAESLVLFGVPVPAHLPAAPASSSAPHRARTVPPKSGTVSVAMHPGM